MQMLNHTLTFLINDKEHMRSRVMVVATGKYVVWVTIFDSEKNKEIASSPRDEGTTL